ncbi:MAG: hypothetical protein L0922_05000, partial [Candidatus Mariimomonas ferrooxydans]
MNKTEISNMGTYLGLDAGSVSVKLAVLDTKGNILKTQYVRHKGKPLSVACELLRNTEPASSISITGSAGRLIADILGINPLNELIAQSYSTKRLYPDVRTIIEMGGEDSKLILLEIGKVKEFPMNSTLPQPSLTPGGSTLPQPSLTPILPHYLNH